MVLSAATLAPSSRAATRPSRRAVSTTVASPSNPSSIPAIGSARYRPRASVCPQPSRATRAPDRDIGRADRPGVATLAARALTSADQRCEPDRASPGYGRSAASQSGAARHP